MARKPRAAPFPVRLTDEQRAELTSRADRAGLSVGGYPPASRGNLLTGLNDFGTGGGDE